MNSKMALVRAAGIICGGILLVAALSKLLNWSDYIRIWKLPSSLPYYIGSALYAALAAFELVLGLELITKPSNIPVAKLALLQFSFFTIIAIAIINTRIAGFIGVGPSCGCFMVKEAYLSEKKYELIRNLIFLGISLVHSVGLLREHRGSQTKTSILPCPELVK